MLVLSHVIEEESRLDSVVLEKLFRVVICESCSIKFQERIFSFDPRRNIIYLLKFIEDFLFRKNGEKFMVLTFSCENDKNHKFIISCTYNICKARILSDPKKGTNTCSV